MAEHAYDHVLELPDVVARRAGRISSDEEERSRRGFDVRPFYRPGARTTSGPLRAGDVEVGRFLYAREGELLLVNWKARASDEEGFRYCDRCRTWITSEEGGEQHVDDNGRNRCVAGGTDEDLHENVLLYVHGHHDFVTLDVPAIRDPSHGRCRRGAGAGTLRSRAGLT